MTDMTELLIAVGVFALQALLLLAVIFIIFRIWKSVQKKKS